jgi:Protein of unknown function (DUF1360)
MSEPRPFAEYAGLSAAFAAVLAGFLATSRARLPERPPATDMVRIGLASYKIGRLVTKDEISSFLRAPVTEDPEATVPKRGGMAGAVGKLLTCPYCVGVWTAAGLSYAHVLAPREARFVTSVFGANAIADFLNGGFVRLREGSPQIVREDADEEATRRRPAAAA